jgi:ATP-dependent Clp protease ATP-binding subunit ClpC
VFERFTDHARRIVVKAQEEARALGHDYIGTEHILLGLIREHDSVAAQALAALGISYEAARRQLEDNAGPSQQEPAGHIPFTPGAKKVLELSLREALQLNHTYIGTEHILLGVIREKGVAAQILVRLGADLEQARRQVIATTEHAQTSDERDPLVQAPTLRQPRDPLTDPSQEPAANGGTTPEPPG